MEQSVSVIVRTRNEEKTIGRTLELLTSQSRKADEIILVDNNSQDRTQAIAKEFGCKVVVIDTPKYNHAHACNEGVGNSSGEIVMFTNGHSEPISNHWIESGLRHFSDPKVAGVFGSELFPEDATVWDKIGRKAAQMYYPGLHGVHHYEKAKLSIGPGLLATISAAIRRDLWDEHHFSEEVAKSGAGEDTEWGFYFLRRGYKIVVDPEFAVYHRHKVPLSKFLQRQANFYYSYWLAYQKSKE